MKQHTLGLMIVVLGVIGGLIACGSGIYFNDTVFIRMGFFANIMQFIGLILVFRT